MDRRPFAIFATISFIQFSLPSLHTKLVAVTLGSTFVTLSNATLSTLTATWNPAGGDELTGYNLLYKKVEDENGTIVNSAKPVSDFCKLIYISIILNKEFSGL